MSTSITTLTGTPQDGIDAVVAFLMTNQQASDAFIPHRKEYALLIAQEFGLSEEICGEIINKLLDDANQTKLFAARKIMDAMSLIAAVEAPTVALERLIAAAAEVGIMYVVRDIATMLHREPTEAEAYAVVLANTRDLSSRGGLQVDFMTDTEHNLLNWASQYIKDPRKIVELREAYREKDNDWKNDLL